MEEVCPLCHQIYHRRLETWRIQAGCICTACAYSLFRYAEPAVPLWYLRGRRLKKALACHFRLPRTIIRELLELCTAEELFDLLSEMEDTGRLAIERQQLWHGAEDAGAPLAPAVPRICSAGLG